MIPLVCQPSLFLADWTRSLLIFLAKVLFSICSSMADLVRGG